MTSTQNLFITYYEINKLLINVFDMTLTLGKDKKFP